MIFLELVLQNFGPYRGRQLLNFRPLADDRSIILLGGMNGGGKTTLMDAIRLALYGHRAQCSTRGNLGYGEFLSQSVNYLTSPEEQTCVELAFEHILDNVPVEFRIKRTWTKNAKGGKDTLNILIDNRLDSTLTQIWDERIEDLLPLGISNLFLFDGEQVKELAQADSPPPAVIEAMRSLLGLELAERLAVDIDILANRKRRATAKAQGLLTLEEIEQKLLQQQAEYQASLQKLADIQQQLEQSQQQQRQASDKFISEGGKIAGERSHLEIQLRSTQQAATAERQTMTELAADILPLALISPLLAQAQAQGQKEARSQQIEVAQDILKERQNRLLNYIEKLDLIPAQVEKIKRFIKKENKQLYQDGQTESWLFADNDAINFLNHILSYLPTQINQANEHLNNLQNQQEEITAIEKKLAAAAPPEVYESLAAAVRQAQAQLSQTQAAYCSARQECDELNIAIEKTKKELSQYTKQNIDQENSDHIIATSTKVQSTLKLFRDRLTLRKLNQLESAVTECFLYLLHKSDLVRRVQIDIHTFSLSLYDLHGQQISKNRLSAGEKQLLAIAFLWGLARVSGRKLPVAIDTPLGRLDSSHRTHLLERYFNNASHQVILLSTDTEVGKVEVKKLRSLQAIAREYLLKYDPETHMTTIESGYFW